MREEFVANGIQIANSELEAPREAELPMTPAIRTNSISLCSLPRFERRMRLAQCFQQKLNSDCDCRHFFAICF